MFIEHMLWPGSILGAGHTKGVQDIREGLSSWGLPLQGENGQVKGLCAILSSQRKATEKKA